MQANGSRTDVRGPRMSYRSSWSQGWGTDGVRVALSGSTTQPLLTASALRHEILTNQLPPGTALHEARDAETLGVSRAPVRDAFRRLAAERLVQIVARRGAVVASLSLREFLDASQLREALETLAVRLATSRLGEADVAELRRLHRLMVREAARQDADAYFRANTAFLNLVVSRTGNRRLHETYTKLINEMRRFRMRSVALRGGLAQSNSEHEAIIKGLEVRDAARAARLLSDHIRVPQDALYSALDGDRVEPPRRGLGEGA